MISQNFIREQYLQNCLDYPALRDYINRRFRKEVVTIEDIHNAIESPGLRKKDRESIERKKMEIDLQKNKGQTGLEKLYQDILIVVSFLLKTDTLTYKELAMLTHLNSTYIRNILHNESLLRDCLSQKVYEKVIQKVRNVERVSNKKHLEELKEGLNNVMTRNKPEQALLDLVTLLLLSKESLTYEQLGRVIGRHPTTVYRNLHDSFRLIDLLGRKLYQEVENKVYEIDYKKEKDEKSNLYKIYDQFFSQYANTRYSVRECNAFFIPLKDLKKDKFIKENYGVQFIDEVKFQKKELGSLLNCGPKKEKAVQDKEMIEILKPGILYLKPYTFKVVEAVVCFFKNYGNIQKCCEKIEGYTYNTFLAFLKDSSLPDILNEENYQNLQAYLSIQKYFERPDSTSRKQLITNTLTFFYQYNGNISRMKEETFLREAPLYRVLTDPMVEKMIGKKEAERIQNIIHEYEDENYVVGVLKKAREKQYK